MEKNPIEMNEEFEKEYKDILQHIESTYEKKVILFFLIMIRLAVRRYMGTQYKTYMGIPVEDVFSFLIDAVIKFL